MGELNKNSAKKVVLFVLAALGNLATAKGSVLSMWALDPSIFNLLQQHSGLHNTCLAVAHPAVHHSVLRLLLLHSSTHTFYQSSSALLGSTSASPTSSHLTNLLTSLGNLITWSSASQTVRSLALKSLYTILVTIKPSADAIVDTEVFELILTSSIKLLATSAQFTKDSLRIFLLLVEDYRLSKARLKMVSHVVLMMLKHADESSRQMGMRLLSKVPLSVLFSKLDGEEMKKYNISKTAREMS